MVMLRNPCTSLQSPPSHHSPLHTPIHTSLTFHYSACPSDIHLGEPPDRILCVTSQQCLHHRRSRAGQILSQSVNRWSGMDDLEVGSQLKSSPLPPLPPQSTRLRWTRPGVSRFEERVFTFPVFCGSGSRHSGI